MTVTCRASKLAVWLLALALPAAAETMTLTLREHLGRGWAPELLTYPFSATLETQSLPDSLQVTGPEGPVPAQFIEVVTWPDSPYVKSAQLALVSGLKPLEQKIFEVRYGPRAVPPPPSDLQVEPEEGEVEITTSEFGLRLLLGEQAYEQPQAATAVPGPVLGMRLPDGRWFGGSGMYGEQRILGYEAAVVEEGPALARWRVRYRYEGGTELAITLDLGAGRARANCETSVTGNDPEDGWRLFLSPGLEPLRLIWRPKGRHRWGELTRDDNWRFGWDDSPREVPLHEESEGLLGLLSPTAYTWNPDAKVGWTFRAGPEGATFCLRRVDAGAWVEPEPPGTWASGAKVRPKMVPLWKEADGEIAMRINNAPGLRRWEMGSGELGECEEDRIYVSSFDPPLNVVKDWVLSWPEDTEQPHPRLYLTREEYERVWARTDPAEADRILTDPGLYQFQRAASAWRLAGTAEVAERGRLIEETRAFLSRRGEEHYMWWGTYPALYDTAMGAGLLSPEEREIFRAQMAYIAYAWADPTLWSMERGYASGNLNMSQARILGLGQVACILADHPQAEAWAAPALRMMEQWLSENGPAGEVPQTASGYGRGHVNMMFRFALAAYRAGLAGHLHDPRMKVMVMCMAKQFSPPDPREGRGITSGLRYHSPAGDQFNFSIATLGEMARAMANEDPGYASALQWVWQRSGRGGDLLVDPDLPAGTPQWSVDVFPHLGAIMRGGLDSGQEDFLYLVTSESLNTLTSEAGSITAFFSKGVPLAHSFLGRYTYRQTHLSNRVCMGIPNPHEEKHQAIAYHGGSGAGMWGGSPPARFGERGGPSTTVAASDLPAQAYIAADFAFRTRTEIPLSGPFENLPPWPELVGGYGEPPVDWRRQLLFLKRDVPGGDRYLIVRDTVQGNASTRWQMWTESEKIGTPEELADRAAFLADKPGETIVPARKLFGDRFTAAGRFGVDLDYYVASPTDTPRHTLRWGEDIRNFTGVIAGHPDYRDLLHLQLAGDGSYFVVLFPRRAGAPMPEFATLGEGHIIRVSGNFGTDYAFLSALPVEANTENVAFRGTAASVQDREGRPVLSLGAAGTVKYGEYSLQAEQPSSLRVLAGALEVELPQEHPGGELLLGAPRRLRLHQPAAGATLQAGATAQQWRLSVSAAVTRVLLVSN